MNQKWFLGVFSDSKTRKQAIGVDRPPFDPFDILRNRQTKVEKYVPQPNIYHSHDVRPETKNHLRYSDSQ